jgi:carboxyl-terminal processing protease
MFKAVTDGRCFASNVLMLKQKSTTLFLVLFLLVTSAFCRDVDLAGKPWPEAFKLMHEQFSREYPYSDWKHVDWDALYKKYQPQIARAAATKNELAYYIALRQYVYSIPDGHVRIRADEPRKLLKGYVGGGFGFTVAELDDGRVVANIVTPDGPAAIAGIEFGSEIMEWDGQPIRSTMARVPLWYDDKPPASTAARILTRCRYLVRAPIGKTVTGRFRDPKTGSVKTAKLTAVDDGYDLLDRTNFYASADDRKRPVDYSILPSGIGYLKIVTFPSPQFGDVFGEVKAALSALMEKKVPSLIVDLRKNGGGDDEVTANVAGLFLAERQFYYSIVYYDPKMKAFGTEPEEVTWVEPKRPRFDGRIVTLISPGTVSNGEGLARSLKLRSDSDVVGMFGTNGAYGSTGGSIKMPHGYLVLYPIGRGLDENRQILIESNASGDGGVLPDIYVPRTLDNLKAATLGGKDVELEFAENVLLTRDK